MNLIRITMFDSQPYYLHRSVAKEVQVHVFPKQISLRMRGVELLPTHKKVTGKIVSLRKRKDNKPSQNEFPRILHVKHQLGCWMSHWRTHTHCSQTALLWLSARCCLLHQLVLKLDAIWIRTAN